MMCVEEKTSLLDEFSGQVQRHLPASVWRSLFLERTGSAQFGTAGRTIVCIECPPAGPITRDGVLAAVNRLARVHGGRVDPCVDDFVLVSFSTAQAGVRLALALQRTTARARLRMGIVAGRCKVARALADGQEYLVLLGRERARVQALAEAAPAGTVQMAPDAYEALGGHLDEAMGSCVVVTEYEGDQLRDITLTLPPDGSADISTFAGLGLT